MKEKDPRVGVGEEAERLALDYLRECGYQLVRKRFRLRNGEIDLIMLEGATLVFVEVRCRRSLVLGDPLESVGPLKRSRIIRAARVFLSTGAFDDRPCRFDVVAVRIGLDGRPRLEHRKDAFRADGRP